MTFSASSPNVLVINGGSSSFKYQILDMHSENRLCQGIVEKIGSPDSFLKHKRFPGTPQEEEFEYKGPYADHAEGMRAVAEVLMTPEKGGVISSEADLAAVGHRVLLAGPGYTEVLVDESVKDIIREYIPLGPLHNPANLAGIEEVERIFPSLPNVAVFDTGFHTTLPDEAYTYAIPQDLAKKHRIRRYGFHGTSHRYVSNAAARFAQKPRTQFNLISCHLGNGCSLCAVKNGRSIDTSMGLTPLEGVVMGTRSGSIDPAILTYLMQADNISPADMDTLLNKQSGLKGLCGNNDMRDLQAAMENGDAAATLAFKIFVYSIRKCIGSYYPVLGQVNAILFTGGIGENSPEVRAAVCADMESLGIKLDPALNQERKPGNRCISTPDSATAVYIIPTDEELEISRATMRVLAAAGLSPVDIQVQE